MSIRQIKRALNYRSTRPDGWIRQLFISIFLLLVTLFGGMTGYMIIEDYDFIESLYMTIITVSTVGFGEVNQLSVHGRIFTMILISFAIFTFAYAASTLSTFILEGGIRNVINDYRNMKMVESMENHVIIAGFGKYGHEVHNALIKKDIPLVVIEMDEEKIAELQSSKTTPFILGDASQDETLTQANISKAKAIVVTLSNDAENVYVCLSARQYNNNLRIISRAVDANIEKKLKRAGADFVVKPEQAGGFHMATLVENPNSIEFMELLSNMGVHFEDVACNQLSDNIVGMSIRDIDLRGKTGIHIVGVRNKDGNYNVNPGPDVILNKSDHLIIIGNTSQITKFVRMLS